MLSIPHLIVIFVVVLVIFGPEKLPELARNLGKIMAEFKRHTGDLRTTFEGHMRDLEREAEDRRIGGANRPAPATTPAQQTPAIVPAAGTVSADAPHAAAIAAGDSPSAETPSNAPGAGNPGQPDLTPPNDQSSDPVIDPLKVPPKDPMHDPYLFAIESELAAEPPAPQTQSPKSGSESRKNSERVSDVRDLPA